MDNIDLKIKENWPSAVEGNLNHPDLGLIHYWTGEHGSKIVIRFKFESQDEGESDKIFFINLKQESWELSHISTFQFSDSKLKLVKNQSFKEQDQLEQKYRSIFELYVKNRKKSNPF